jgi:hypothetical protein
MAKKRVGGDHALAEEIANMLDREAKARPGDNAAALLQAARDAGGGDLRMHYLARAQREIAKLNPTRHGPLIQRLQAQALALQGRGGDTRIAHVAPGEVVIPRSLMTPALMEKLTREARRLGIDPASLQIGSGRNVINPRTGMPQFDEEDLEDQGTDAADDMGAGGGADDEDSASPPLPTNMHDLAQHLADKLDQPTTPVSPQSTQTNDPFSMNHLDLLTRATYAEAKANDPNS